MSTELDYNCYNYDLNNFTDRAKKILERAKDEATRLENDYIGVNHIFLGILKDQHSVAGKVLHDFNIEYDYVQKELSTSYPKGNSYGYKSQLFTTLVEHLLKTANQYRVLMEDIKIGTEHILLSFIDMTDNHSVLYKIFKKLGVEDISVIKDQIYYYLNKQNPETKTLEPSEQDSLIIVHNIMNILAKNTPKDAISKIKELLNI